MHKFITIKVALTVMVTFSIFTIILYSCGSSSSNSRTVQTLYVANYYAGIQIFNATDSGDVAPKGTIYGPNSTLTNPVGVAVDGAGLIWVTGDNALKVFAAGSASDVAPVQSISGINTMLSNPEGIAINSSGKIAVGQASSNIVVIFDKSSDGNVAPGSYFSASGMNNPRGVAFDSSGNLWVTSTSDDTIFEFSASSIAAAAGAIAPINTISGGNTQLSSPIGIAVDQEGRIIVSNLSINAVTIFAAGATGNVAPSAVIAGGNTNLHNPFYIGLSNDGNFSLGGNSLSGPVVTFSSSTTGGDIVPLYQLNSSSLNYPVSTAYR